MFTLIFTLAVAMIILAWGAIELIISIVNGHLNQKNQILSGVLFLVTLICFILVLRMMIDVIYFSLTV